MTNNKIDDFYHLFFLLKEEIFMEVILGTIVTTFGIKGEGLLKYLKDLDKDRDENAVKLIQEINKGLHLLEWFDGFSIPEDLLSNEYKLSIGDKYLKESIKYFDQRSTNEGFLYLLFYLINYGIQMMIKKLELYVLGFLI